MTLPSRRKRPTTARGRTNSARTPVEWAAALALVVFGGLAHAQAPISSYNLRPVPATPGASLEPAVSIPRAPSMQVPSAMRPVRYQEGGRDDDPKVFEIQLTPPSLERLSRLDSDAKLQERIRQERKNRLPHEEVIFPDSPILSRDRYLGRKGLWPQRQMVVEPGFVCYGKLFFEDKNAERYGWELGLWQPFLSPLKFYADTILFPMRWGADPCCPKDCSSGHCLPGDPVPFLFYPPEITPSGVAAEIGVILALVAIFP